MSDEADPFQITEKTDSSEKPLAAQGGSAALTGTMLLYLKGASPWLRFIGILGFIATGLAALSGLIIMVFSSFMGQLWEEADIGVFGGLFNSSGGGIVMGLFYLVCAAIMIFPVLYIYRFGEKIQSYLMTGKEQDLEQAFKNNKSYWKFMGILYIIYLACIPLILIFAVIVTVAGAASAFY